MNEWQARMARFYAQKYRCRCGLRSTVRLVHCPACGDHRRHHSVADPDVEVPCRMCGEDRSNGPISEYDPLPPGYDVLAARELRSE